MRPRTAHITAAHYRAEVLAALAEATEPMTLGDVCRALSLRLSAAERAAGRTVGDDHPRRVLKSLVAEGLAVTAAVQRPAQYRSAYQSTLRYTGYKLVRDRQPKPQRSKPRG